MKLATAGRSVYEDRHILFYNICAFVAINLWIISTHFRGKFYIALIWWNIVLEVLLATNFVCWDYTNYPSCPWGADDHSACERNICLVGNLRSDHNPLKSVVPSDVSLHPALLLAIWYCFVILYWTQTREDHYFSADRECLLRVFTSAPCSVTVSRWWGRVIFWNRDIQSSWISAIEVDRLHKQAVRSETFWNRSQYLTEWTFRSHFSLVSRLYSESFSLIIDHLKPTGHVIHQQV
jgi:hypothetical protein